VSAVPNETSLSAEQQKTIADALVAGSSQRAAAEAASASKSSVGRFARSPTGEAALKAAQKRAGDRRRQAEQARRNAILNRRVPGADIEPEDGISMASAKVARARGGADGRVLAVVRTGGLWGTDDFSSTEVHAFGGATEAVGLEAVLDRNDARRERENRECYGNSAGVVNVIWPCGRTGVDVRDPADVARAARLVVGDLHGGNEHLFDAAVEAISNPPPGTGEVGFA
jgi:hypothetical protein